MSFQGIVTDVEKCHTVSNWETKALIPSISCGGIFILSDRDSLGCERTSIPSPIRRCRNMSCEYDVMVNHVHSRWSDHVTVPTINALHATQLWLKYQAFLAKS